MCVYIYLPLYIYIQRLLLPPSLPPVAHPPCSQLAVIAGTVSAALRDHFSSIKSCKAEGVLSNSTRAPLLPYIRVRIIHIYIVYTSTPSAHAAPTSLLTPLQTLLGRMKLYIRGVVGCMYTHLCVCV